MKIQSLLMSMTLLTAVLPARGGTLDENLISADARWLIHADVGQLRDNPIAAALRDQHLGDRAAEKMRQARVMMGLETWDDLKSVVLYGTTFEHHRGVMIITAKCDRDAVIARLKVKSNYKATADGGHVMHSWMDGGGRKGKGGGRGRTMYLSFLPGDRAVLSRHQGDFTHAVAILDGEEPSVADGDGRLDPQVPVGASIYMQAAGPVQVPGDDHRAKLLRKVKQLNIAAVHGEGDMTMKLTLQATDAEVAMQIEQLLVGLRAMMLLRQNGPDHDETRQLITAMSVRTEGDTVHVQWPVPNEKVSQWIARRAKKRHGG